MHEPARCAAATFVIRTDNRLNQVPRNLQHGTLSYGDLADGHASLIAQGRNFTT
jgi:hypothetical protein